MATSDGFRRLADLLAALETTNVEVSNVSVPEGTEHALVADIRVRIVPDAAGDPPDLPDALPAGDSDGDPEETPRGDGDRPAAGSGFDDAGADDAGADGDGDAETDRNVDGRIDGNDDRDVDSDTDSDTDRDAARDGDREADGDVDSNPAADPGSGADGVACRAEGCTATFETEHGMKIHHTKVHGPSLTAEGAAPTHRDPDALREAYERHDSFTEMTEALGVDVTPQTVRRNMIDHGIHDPNGDDGGTDPDHAADDEAGRERDDGGASAGADDGSRADGDGGRAESRADGGRVGNRTDDGQVEERADGGRAGDAAVPGGTDDAATGDPDPTLDCDLPAGVTVSDLKAAVETASTVYEVQRALDVDRERAIDILEGLGLLELVHGRVATKRRRDDLKDEIDERIRASGEGAASD